MRKAGIWFKDEEAGLLTQHDDGAFTFRYHDGWMANPGKPAISLTLPKSAQEYHSAYLFPFFFNMLPEGVNKYTVCRLLRLDPADHFGLLLSVASYDSIGAVRVFKQETTP